VAGRARFLLAVAILLAAAVEGSSLIKAASDLIRAGSGLMGVSSAFTEISFFMVDSGLTSSLTGLTRVCIFARGEDEEQPLFFQGGG
jgi:hypothetical protein